VKVYAPHPLSTKPPPAKYVYPAVAVVVCWGGLATFWLWAMVDRLMDWWAG